MQELIIFSCAFGAVFILLYQGLSYLDEKIPHVSDDRKMEYPGVPEFLTPFIRVVARLVDARVGSQNPYVARIRDKMKYSRSFRSLSPSELLSIKALLGCCTMTLGVLVLVVNRVSPLEDPLAFIGFLAILGVLGFTIPTMPMDNALVRRQQSILRNWPFFMDLLTISIEAGMDYTSSVKRLVRDMSINPLTEELLQYLNEVQLGKRKVEAIRAMADRINVAAIQSVLMMLAQAETLGTPLGPLLRNQTREFREHKAQLVEKKAMEAPVKMLFPLLVFIFPAILIVLLGPVIMKYMKMQ